MKRSDIKIKDCFWFKNGKCLSPEIYRFRYDEGDNCLYNPEQEVFVYEKKGMNPLRCLGFRRKEVEAC